MLKAKSTKLRKIGMPIGLKRGVNSLRKHTIVYCPLESISVGPNRQRKDMGDIEGLAASIASNGLINPITVSLNPHGIYQIIAGERRFRAFEFLNENNPGIEGAPGPYSKIPAIYYEDLDKFERYVLELEENVSRKDLSWTEQAVAALRLHMALENMNENSEDPKTEWTPAMTADRVGKSRTWVRENVMVGREVIKKDKQVLACLTLSQAVNTISRRRERVVQDKLNVAAKMISEDVHKKTRPLAEETRESKTLDLHTLGLDGSSNGEASVEQPLGSPPVERSPFERLPKDSNVICGSFFQWAREYRGVPFNVVHCDFPYGINYNKSDQGGSKRTDSYEDNPVTYFGLLDTLIKYWDNFATPHAHIIFWFSMKWYNETVQKFTEAGYLVCNWPLIWYKSDHSGIASRPQFWPRHVYETALFITKGDRKILQPFPDCYAAPLGKLKALHLSEKPVPMLKHFLKLTVDSNARVLDPTCGAGSALRAADDLDAELVIGVELDEKFATTAQQELEKARWKRKANEAQKEKNQEKD